MDCNPDPRIDGLDLQSNKTNYLVGNEASKWRSNISNYARVKYRDVWPGVDLVYYGNQSKLEYDFVAKPGANLHSIQIEFEGMRKLFLNSDGDLVMEFEYGSIVQHKPVIYQQISGIRKSIGGRYLLKGRRVSFDIGRHDAGEPLVIDPVLSYSTFIAGKNGSTAANIAVDASGNAYVAGWTNSIDFPTTPGVLTPTLQGGTDIFVAKLNAAGTALVYSTLLGGFRDDYPNAVAVDSSGNAFITGYTSSSDFPITPGAYQNTFNSPYSGFAVALNAQGTALLYSTYFQPATRIAVDSAGNAYLGGAVSGPGFPTTPGVFQPSLAGVTDVFVAKLNNSGSSLIYATLLGGSDQESLFGMAVDSTGNVYVTGVTQSNDFPVTAGAYQGFRRGQYEIFVSKINAQGTALVYSTFIGGSGDDQGNAIAIDSDGNAYVTGYTRSSDFPATSGSFRTFANSNFDAFVFKLNPVGTALVYSTYLGGTAPQAGLGIAVDSAGNAYVTGWTTSADFPITPNAIQKVKAASYSSDIFVSKLNRAGTILLFSTYIGGYAQNDPRGIIVDAQGSIYLTGTTYSANFPTTPGAFDRVYKGGPDAFALKISDPLGGAAVTPASGSGSSQSFNFTFSDPNGFASIASTAILFSTSPDTGSNACFIYFSRSSNAVYLINDAGTGSTRIDIGAAATAQNSQCAIAGSDASVTGAGTTLALNLSIAFKPGFTGAKNVYLNAIDLFGATSPFDALGAWTVTAGPRTISVTPDRGSGFAQSFSFVVSEPTGFTGFTSASMLFNSAPDGKAACFLYFDRASNAIFLIDDAGLASTRVSLGSFATAQNSQCLLSGSGSSATGSGFNLTLTVALVFKTAFAGNKNVYLSAQSSDGSSTGLQKLGSWTVTANPKVVSVNPNLGSGPSQTFAVTLSDASGFADLSSATVLINSALDGKNACFLYYDRASNAVFLIGDAGAGSTRVDLGTAATAENSQCSFNATGSTASSSGSILTLKLAVSFKPIFSGNKMIYAAAQTNLGITTGLQAIGTWRVTGNPALVSVTPASGSGNSQAFTFVYSDLYGYKAITTAYVLINFGLNGSNACFISYDAVRNALFLLNDQTTNSTRVDLGSSMTAENTQCLVTGTGSSVSGSGNLLTLTVALTFKPGFNGLRNIYLSAQNNLGLVADLQPLGNWTVTAAPSVEAVGPGSGSGQRDTFAFYFFSAKGYTDIYSATVLLNSSLDGRNACFVYYDRASNAAFLIDDASVSSTRVDLNTPASAQNSQCTLNGTGSYATFSGNSLVLNLSLSFKQAFTGSKNIYVWAQGSGGTSIVRSNWMYNVTFGPAIVLVTPNQGAGLLGTMNFIYSDPDGPANIASATILFNSTLDGRSACFVYFDRVGNAFYLINDTATGSTRISPGSNGRNSQCIVDAGSRALIQGNSLVVTLVFTFLPAFTGSKTIYTSVTNMQGTSTGLQAKGSWAVQ